MAGSFDGQRIHVIPHNQRQLETLGWNQKIPPHVFRRIFREEDLLGIDRIKMPLFLLPGWFLNLDMEKAVKAWKSWGGKTVHISEEVVTGKDPWPTTEATPTVEGKDGGDGV